MDILERTHTILALAYFEFGCANFSCAKTPYTKYIPFIQASL